MVARVTMYEDVDLDLADRVKAHMEGLGADPFAGLPGYQGSMTLVDRDNARLVGIGFYATAGDAEEADALLSRMPDQVRDELPEDLQASLMWRPASVGLYEVAHRD